MQEKGYVKFDCQWLQKAPFEDKNLHKLIEWRNKLYNLGLIGCYDNGIGYGNISIRKEKNSFFITGSATGDIKELSYEHISLVTSYNIDNNHLECSGPIKASSESLTHATVYETIP